MKSLVTADMHFGDENIICYCARPFSSIKDMEEKLISNWNSVVDNRDIVYNIGDLAFWPRKCSRDYCRVLKQLKGRHVLILGNHDKLYPFEYIKYGVESVHTSLILRDKILLAHDPAIATVMPHNMIMLCGHLHELFSELKRAKHVINAGCDLYDYTPVEMTKLIPNWKD